jgi:hypothetical protein
VEETHKKKNSEPTQMQLLAVCLLVMPYRISLTSLERTSVPINLLRRKRNNNITSRSSGAATIVV